MWDFFLTNSPYIFITYILIKELVPVLKSVLDRIVPGRIARIARRDEKEQERTDREIDLKEREIIVMEQFAKSQILMSERLNEFNRSMDALLYSQTTVNTSLSVLLDRDRRFRATDETQPFKTIKRPE